MRYAVVIEKGESSYGAYVPDLPGCVAAGDSKEQVILLIQEAIEFHIEGLKEEGQSKGDGVRRASPTLCEGHTMNAHRTVEGCHCGNVTVRVELIGDLASYEPRSCDREFCRMHGSAYISDPGGRLRIHIEEENRFGRYRQGAERADMLFCANCGVLVGACYKEEEKLFGVVNVRVFSDDFGPTVDVSPKRLGPEEKAQRWKEVWFGDVRFETPYA